MQHKTKWALNLLRKWQMSEIIHGKGGNSSVGNSSDGKGGNSSDGHC